MVELVDTHALGACANRLAGSTPVAGTIIVQYITKVVFLWAMCIDYCIS